MSTNKQEPRYHRWVCTHKGWIVLCPVYFANFESEAPTPVPRKNVPEFWMDWMFAVNDAFQWIISIIDPGTPLGYVFWGVEELSAPITIEVKAL